MHSKKSYELWSTLGVWLVSVVMWGLFRYFLRPVEWIEELIFKPIIFIVPVAVFLRSREYVSLKTLGLRTVGKKVYLLWGIVFGLILVGENIFILLKKGQTFNLSAFTFPSLVANAFISIATSLSEEILYRGFLLERLAKILGRDMIANFFTSLLFSLGHLAIAILVLGYMGFELTNYLWLVFVLGFANGYSYLQTRSVFAPMTTHALWNFSIGLFT